MLGLCALMLAAALALGGCGLAGEVRPTQAVVVKTLPPEEIPSFEPLPDPTPTPVPTPDLVTPAKEPESAAEALAMGKVIHAGGRVKRPSGKSAVYTNSLEALENAYWLGHRVVEIDFNWTTDGKLVALHGWRDKVSADIVDGQPLSLEQWLHTSVYKDFTPMWLGSVAGFLESHPHLYIVTDVKENNVEAAQVIAEEYPELMDRFIIQIYRDSQYDKVHDLGFDNIIYTLYDVDKELKADVNHWIKFAQAHPLLGYTYPDTWLEVEGYTQKMLETGVPLFTHTINKPEQAEKCYADGLTGIYTDEVEW